MVSQAPIRFVASGPVSCGATVWRAAGVVHVTVALKASFGLIADALAMPLAPLPLVAEDVFGNAFDSLAEPNDLAPYLPNAGVLLWGNARPPKPCPMMTVRLGVFRGGALVDKTLNVVGPRSGGPPAHFHDMPIVYERAFGGPGVEDNPAGIGADGRTQPNILDPKNPRAPAGFGPLSRRWRARRQLLGSVDPAAIHAPNPDFPRGFDWRYFHAAPADQQCSYLQGDEWIVLEGMFSELPGLRSQLPSAHAFARWVPAGASGPQDGVDIGLVADTLLIDARTRICSVVWRGRFNPALVDALTGSTVFAGVETANLPRSLPTSTSAGATAVGNRALESQSSRAAAQGGPPSPSTPLSPAPEPPSAAPIPSGFSGFGEAPGRESAAARAAGPASPEPTRDSHQRSTQSRLGATAALDLRQFIPDGWSAGAPFALAEPGSPASPPREDIPGAPWSPPSADPPKPVKRNPLTDTNGLDSGQATRGGWSVGAPFALAEPGSHASRPSADIPGAPWALGTSAEIPREAPRSGTPDVPSSAGPIGVCPSGVEWDETVSLPASSTPAKPETVTAATAPPPAERETLADAMVPPLAKPETATAATAPPPAKPETVTAATAPPPAKPEAVEPAEEPGRAAPLPLRSSTHSVATASGAGEAQPASRAAEQLPAPSPTEASPVPPTPATDEEPGSPRRAAVLSRLKAREPLSDLSLAGADLQGIDFGGAVLSRLDLRGAKLMGCGFADARLPQAQLNQADLSHADLSRADLTEANLAGANLCGARLDGARLVGANLSGAQGAGASFANAEASRATFAKGHWHDATFAQISASYADFSGASLAQANFRSAALIEGRFVDATGPGAIFDEARLSQALAGGSSFEGASFRAIDANASVWGKAVLNNASFAGAHLKEADLSRASCLNTIFEGAELVGANLQRLSGDGANFCDACLNGADLRLARLRNATFDRAALRDLAAGKAELGGCSFKGADLRDAMFRGARLPAANFAHANLEGIDLRDADVASVNVFGASRKTAKLGANAAGLVEVNPDIPTTT